MKSYRIFTRPNRKSAQKTATNVIIKANSHKEAAKLAAGRFTGLWVSAQEEETTEETSEEFKRVR
jgi:hypothetical protein